LNAWQTATDAPPSKPAKFLLDTPILAIALTLLTYLRCVGNQFVFDDIDMVVKNAFISRWSMIWKSFVSDSWWFIDPLNLPHSAYYRPLQDVWLSLNYHLFGFAPAGWHLSLVALHLVVVWLVFEVARDLSGSRWTPVVAATLFGLMPVHAQAVVWPTAVPLPMSAAFELLALLCFTRSEHPIDRNGWLSIFFYILALLSHESAAAFPMIIVAYEIILAPERDPQLRGASFRDASVRAAFRSWPFFVLLAAYLFARYAVLGSSVFGARREIMIPMTWIQLLLTLPKVLAVYLEMLLIPWKAGPAHPMEVVLGITSPKFYLPFLLLAGVALFAVALLRNSPHRRLYLFCAVWIGLALLPTLNIRILQVEDRYLYMSSIAWCLMVADLAVSGFEAASLPITLVTTVGAAVVILEATFLFHIEKFWHDNFVLFSECTRLSPDAWYYHDHLADELSVRNDFEGAKREYLTSLRIKPNDVIALLNLASVRGNLGETADAVKDLRHAFDLMPAYKGAPSTYVGLATTAYLLGAKDLRDAALKRALDLRGGADAVDIGRAEMMLNDGDVYGAQDRLQSALARSPDNIQAWALLGAALAREGKTSAAINAYKQVLTLGPSPKMKVAVEAAVGRLNLNVK
jgi:Flp pilus assembly protein TadD